MFTDNVGRLNDGGVGPSLQLLAIIYLCYLAVYKNVKIPSLFFILYGIGAILFSIRYNNLLKSDSTLYNKHTSSFSFEIMNIYTSFVLCLITAILVW